jgi:hypothetical protein
LEKRAFIFLPESRHRNGLVQKFDIFGPGIRKASMFLIVRGEDQVNQEKQQNVVTRCLRPSQQGTRYQSGATDFVSTGVQELPEAPVFFGILLDSFRVQHKAVGD